MKTHKILFEHLGEYSYTEKSPVKVYVEGIVDLSEKTSHAILGSDDFRPCPVTRWEVREVALPDWMPPERYLARCDYVRWKFVWSSHPDAKTWPQTWQGFLFRIDEYKREAAVKLLATKNFRSDFRQSLREQLERWLDTPESERQYASPFSQRQWQALLKYERRRR